MEAVNTSCLACPDALGVYPEAAISAITTIPSMVAISETCREVYGRVSGNHPGGQQGSNSLFANPPGNQRAPTIL